MIRIFFTNLYRDLVRQPLRTFLTLSGVVWGTFSVVVLLAFGTGLEKQNVKRFHGMGQGIILAFPGSTTMAYKGFTKGRRVDLTPEDIMGLKEHVPGIKAISPEFIQSYRIRYGREVLFNTVRGITPDFLGMRNTIAEKGRFIDPADMADKRRVCFIGGTLAKDLFKGEEPVGKQVFIAGVPFTVIGVMIKKQQNSNYNGQRDEFCAFIPWTTYTAIFGVKYVRTFILQPEHPQASKQLIAQLRDYLGERHGFSPRDKDALFVWDTLDIEKQFKILFGAFNVFFAMIGSFTLLVGGVGVAAIMYVVVEERTREIGVKLAVGAKRSYILRQFFFESLSIVFLGGIVGFCLAVILLGILPQGKINEFIGFPVVNPLVGIVTVIVLVGIGVVSGLLPARLAASTNPIEALRK